MKIRSLNAPYRVTPDEYSADLPYPVKAMHFGLISEMHHHSNSKKQISKQKLLAASEMFPGIPHIKHYLGIWYFKARQMEKWEQVNRELVRDYPDYIFGKIHLAQACETKKDWEGIYELFGRSLRVEDAFPGRKAIHLQEFCGFQVFATNFFALQGNLEEVLERVDSIHQWDTDGDFFDTLTNTLNKHFPTMFDKRAWTDGRLSPANEQGEVDYKNLRRKFIHPEIEKLYTNGIDIDLDIIEKLINKADYALVNDLKRVLLDSVRKQEYFFKKVKAQLDDEFDDSQTCFPVHALVILSELEDTEASEIVKLILRQDENYYFTYFSAYNLSSLAELFGEILRKDITSLKDQFHTEGSADWSKLTILFALNHCTLLDPKSIPAAKKFLGKVMDFHLTGAELPSEKKVILPSVTVIFATRLRAVSLLSRIEKLYKKGWIIESLVGQLDEVRDMTRQPAEPIEYEFLPFQLRYLDLLITEDIIEGIGDKLEDIDKEDPFPYESPLQVIRQSPKVGRNEPCPCGSGKKYKKCCLSK